MYKKLFLQKDIYPFVFLKTKTTDYGILQRI